MIPRCLERVIDSSQMCGCTFGTYISSTYNDEKEVGCVHEMEQVYRRFCGCRVIGFLLRSEECNSKAAAASQYIELWCHTASSIMYRQVCRTFST